MEDSAVHLVEVPEWVQDLYALVDADQYDVYLNRYYAEDAGLKFGAGPLVHGRDAIRTALAEGPGAQKLEHTIRNLWQAGDTTIIEFDVVYTFSDGSKVDAESLAILDRADGMVKQLRVYIDYAPVRERAEAVAPRAR